MRPATAASATCRSRHKPPVKPAKPQKSDGYLRLLSDYYKLEERNTVLMATLNAKEAQASRNWPADMEPRQIKRRDKCLQNIAWWQRQLEQLYGEVTGQPSWRVEVTTKDGRRLGTGARFGTRGEAEFYNRHFATTQVEDYASGDVIACGSEKANVEIDGDTIRFAHGNCVLLNWHPITLGADHAAEVLP
jgi:hypothetical protein